MPGVEGTGLRWRRVLPFLLVTGAAAAIVFYKVRSTVAVGPEWDAYAFLANAAEFAGKGYGYTELHRPPFLSLLTALVFRAGAPMEASVIQWVDGAVSLSGIAAAYLLFSRRIPRSFAAIAALSLLAVQPLWGYLGSGYTDFPSVSISLWMLLACIKATEVDSRYYTVAAVLFVAAVMTRYTALLAAFPAATWLALRWRPFRNARALGVAAVAAVAAYAPAGIYYAARFNDALFPFILAFGVSEDISSPGGEGSQVASGLWYVRGLPVLLAPEALWALTALVLVIAGLGLMLTIEAHARLRRPTAHDLTFVALGIAPALIAQFAGAGMIVRQFTIPIAVVAMWRYYAGTRGERGISPRGALDAAMLCWLLAYLDLHGHQSIQIGRYFITMAVPVLYFIALGWYRFGVEMLRRASRRGPEPGQRLASVIAATTTGYAITAIVALAVTASVGPVRPAYEIAARESSAWLLEHGAGAGDVVYSDLWPLTAWYTRLPARAMPFFKSSRAFQHELDKSSAAYYLSIAASRRNYAGFTEVARSGDVAVMKRSSEASTTLPRILYLGKGWDNYLESVIGFDSYLDSDAGRYGWEGTAFFDSLNAEKLAAYDVVALYGLKWRDRAAGERALRTYVEQGGSVVLDASQNLSGLAYSIADTVMLDTVVRRQGVPADAKVQVAPAFSAAHPEIGTIGASPFIDETGGPWNGAAYEALPGLPPLKTLATVGGRPVIQLQSLGKGRIYWIGENLVWHAFSKENQGEMRLVRAVFDDALADAAGSPTPITPAGAGASR